jgi:hypothetical protein
MDRVEGAAEDCDVHETGISTSMISASLPQSRGAGLVRAMVLLSSP